MDLILDVKRLTRSFKEFKLDQVSFALPPGYIMGLIGPNGAGKTTTIKLIMNLIKRDSGKINIFGKDNREYEKDIKQRIGFVYDESHFYGHLTIDETRRIIAPFYRNWDEKLFQKYQREFSLSPKQKIQDLSRGMKMKFSLALALSHHAEMILMDEPTSGLDPVFRNELLNILQEEMQDEGRGILFSSHITSDLERIADYVCFINRGKVVFSRPCDEVIHSHLLIKGPHELLSPDIKKHLLGLRENNFGFEALTGQPETVRALLGDRVVYERPKLDDIILFTVKGVDH